MDQLARHIVGKLVRAVVEVRNPPVDLVQLEEDAGRALVVAVVVLLGALFEVLDVHIADLPGRRRLVVLAVENVLTAAGVQSGSLVN